MEQQTEKAEKRSHGSLCLSFVGNAAADEGHADTSRNFSSEKRCVFALTGQLGGSDRPACRPGRRCRCPLSGRHPRGRRGKFEYARRFGSDPGDGLTEHVGAVAMFHGPFQGERQEQFQSGGARGGFAERREFSSIVIDRRVVRADGVDRAIEQALRDGFTVFTWNLKWEASERGIAVEIVLDVVFRQVQVMDADIAGDGGSLLFWLAVPGRYLLRWTDGTGVPVRR